MHLLRCLFFIAAALNFWYGASHIPGKMNIAADAISRNNVEVLFEVIPNINSSPLAIPQTLIQLVAPGSPEWISPSWVKQFQKLYCMALAPSTKRSYQPAQKRFTAFCMNAGASHHPVSEELLFLCSVPGQRGPGSQLN